MSETGIYPYDLIGNWCEECGRPKIDRLLGFAGNCGTCTEAITRHRCTKRPELAAGGSWTCPDCGTIWTAGEEEKTCGECGQGTGTMRRTWDTVPGDRIGTAPRYKPEPFTSFRDALRQTVNAVYAGPALPSPPRECYRMPNGLMVHVKPGCRCKR